MTEISYIASDTETSIIKLKNSLDLLSTRNATSDGSSILSEAMASFKNFFDTLSEPEFVPEELTTGDTPRSEVYNKNLRSIYNDISRFYVELNNLTSSNIKSYNYSQVVIAEIKKRAEALSSIVLDLNILNNFTRGDVIVAGDDFINLSNIDKSAALGAPPAELLSGGTGLGLARSTTVEVTRDPRVKIDVIPISPSNKTTPTPNNYERFYEGNYYNLLGLARPEGGKFNIRYSMIPSSKDGTPDPTNLVGIFLDYGATDEQKQETRSRMFDGNPDTFWECEYVYKLVNPLVANLDEAIVLDEKVEIPLGGDPNQSETEAPVGASIQIDSNDLNSKALAQDITDLVVDLIITFPQEIPINIVTLNPILFSKNAYIVVQDISTCDSTNGIFSTVDGWNQLKYPKSLTPEANEYLTDSQLFATLAPSRSNYSGQGIFPFPIRIAKKVKVRISMPVPVAQTYERTYVLLKNTIDADITTTTTTKKGILRF